jgi:hypothetical protein
MDTSHLPLIQRCMEKAEEYEKAGDSENALKFLELAEKAEIYYSKQNYKTADVYYKELNGNNS